MGPFPDYTGFLLPRPAYNALKPMIISHDQLCKVVPDYCVLGGTNTG